MIKKLSFSESHKLLSQGDVVLLDVREEEEYITGHAIDAQLLPLDEIDRDTAAAVIPTTDTPVMVYCRTGYRSAKAARMLEDLGYRTVYDMGGLAGWPYGLE